MHISITHLCLYKLVMYFKQQQQQRLIPLGGVGYMDQLPPQCSIKYHTSIQIIKFEIVFDNLSYSLFGSSSVVYWSSLYMPKPPKSIFHHLLYNRRYSNPLSNSFVSNLIIKYFKPLKYFFNLIIILYIILIIIFYYKILLSNRSICQT